jgi:hypothetical protein
LQFDAAGIFKTLQKTFELVLRLEAKHFAFIDNRTGLYRHLKLSCGGKAYKY